MVDYYVISAVFRKMYDLGMSIGNESTNEWARKICQAFRSIKIIGEVEILKTRDDLLSVLSLGFVTNRVFL